MAVVLRVGSALYQGNIVEPLPGIHDQVSYDALAKRLLGGHGFSFEQDHWPLTRAGEPTAHWSYLYTLYLSVIYALGGGPILARLIQAIIAGILHPWLAWRLGYRLGGSPVGWMSAALSAVYIYFFYYAGSLMTETFYIIAILWTMDCALRLDEVNEQKKDRITSSQPEWRLWLELGLAIGVTVLLRQVFLLFVPVLFLWLWWNRGQRVWYFQILPLLSGSLLTVIVVLALVAPWTIRNYRVFNALVPLNTNSGYAFFWGNHPIYGTNFVGILPSDGPSYQDLIPAELRHLNEAELDRALLKEGIQFVLDDPERYILLSISRTREYFKFWPSPESGLISNIARVGSFGLLLPLILFGLVMMGHRAIQSSNTHTPRQRATIVLFLLFATAYTALHLLTWALIRYRLPVDAILLLFAAAGSVALAKRARGLQNQTANALGKLA